MWRKKSLGITSGSRPPSTPFWNHLKYKHSTEYNDFKAKNETSATSSTTDSPIVNFKESPTGKSFFGRDKHFSILQQQKIENVIV